MAGGKIFEVLDRLAGIPGYDATPEALEATASDAEVTVTPNRPDDGQIGELVRRKRGIVFAPTGAQASTGLIIYPGALVDARAYAVAARAIARRGHKVVVAPMPGRVAIAGYARARTIAAAHPEVSTWFLAGHSLGGAMAVRFMTEDSGVVLGLVLWAAYPAEDDDLSVSGVPALVVYGTRDGVSTPEEVEEGLARLPPGTETVKVEGANHGQFGYYGEQEGDLEAGITREAQHAAVVEATVAFMRSRGGA
eukprot:evm.model.scf_502.2 EVM.evm.TU.scf_502.2   scf_502:43607-44359(-)